jgi:apolipoprotein N-acyltransferase
LVQINIPQDAARVLWEPEQVHLAYEEETRKGLEELAGKDVERMGKMAETQAEGEIQLTWPDWVIWPESALTGRVVSTADGAWGMWRENHETVRQVQQSGPFQLIQGMVELEGEDIPGHGLVEKSGGRAWNVLAVISPEGELATYRKRHLVIFGETIPLVEEIPWLKAIYKQQTGQEFGGAFAHGTSAEPLVIPDATGKRIGVIPSVCFEDTVPRLVRPSLRVGPQVIVNVTNDGWFKQSAAAAQHFANARFRCIEFRRPLLRSANSGVSAAVDTLGRLNHPDTGVAQVIVDSKGSHFTRGSLLVEVKVPEQPATTFYAIVGDWGLLSLLLIVLVGDGIRVRRLRCTNALPASHDLACEGH